MSDAVNESKHIQPVSEKKRLEMFVGMKIEILIGQRSGFFSNEESGKRP